MPLTPLLVRPTHIRRGAPYQPAKMTEVEFYRFASARGMIDSPARHAMYCVYVLGMRKSEAATAAGVSRQQVWNGVRDMEAYIVRLHPMRDYLHRHELARDSYSKKARAAYSA